MKLKEIKPLPLWQSFILFALPSIYFLAVTYLLMPLFIDDITANPVLGWIIGGYILFIPIFILSFILYKIEGNYFNFKMFFERFRIKKVTLKNWGWIFFSILAIFFLNFIIVSISKILTEVFGIRELKVVPAFIKISYFHGFESLILLLLWLPMFFLNIFGEELLWRGYILPRMELRHKEYSWLINALLWMMFHLTFGLDLMILLLPTFFILPFAVYKTKNTTVGVIMHALLNGPMFILLLFGFIK